MKLRYWTTVFGTSFFLNMAVHALPLRPQIPTISQPRQIQNHKPLLPPQNKLQPNIQQKQAAKKPPQTAASAVTSAEKLTFTFNGVHFKGNTAFSSKELDLIFANDKHKNISLAKLTQLVAEITKKYRSNGYILSRAILPPQVVKKGVVTVQIIEGYVKDVRIKGKSGKLADILQKYAKTVTESRPLKISDLEKALLLMNDLPGVTVKAVLTPAPRSPGAADLTLISDYKFFNVYLSYDNFGTRYIGPQETGGGVTFYNITTPGSSDSFRFITDSRTSELQYYEVAHSQAVGENGAKVTVGANYSNSAPQFTLADFEVRGRSNSIYTDFTYPLLRTRTKNFYVHAMANYQNVTSTILGQPFYDDRIRSVVVGGEYNNIDSLRGINDVKMDLEKGFNIFGANQHVNQSRPRGDSKFSKTNLAASRLQALPWQLSMLGAVHGQYAFNPLLATEQFSFGGPEYGRGYDPSEIVGDHGVGGKIELRKDSAFSQAWLSSMQYYLFYDAGVIWNRDTLNLPAKQSATSTGFGARMNFIPQLSGNFFLAQPLSHSVATQVAMNKDPYKPRAYFQLLASID